VLLPLLNLRVQFPASGAKAEEEKKQMEMHFLIMENVHIFSTFIIFASFSLWLLLVIVVTHISTTENPNAHFHFPSVYHENAT
jgi:hypothetical protein